MTTFAQRCAISEQCLPDAPYRAMLTKLHAEMLAEIGRLQAAQKSREQHIALRDAFAGGGKLIQATHQCHWWQSDDDSPDTWEGTCGAMWTFTDGGPKDNQQAYCPQCGGVCIEVRAEQKGGES